MLPRIGTLTGSGRTTEEMRASIEDRLREHIDGDVHVSVAVEEYQPIYIDGDVVRPGSYAHRAGLTVGMAVATAGGRQSVRASGAPLGQSQEQEQLDLLLDAHRADVAREARLLAELAGKQDVVFPADLEAAAPASARVREVLDDERAVMQSRASLQSLETESLKRRISGFEQVIVELESQRQAIATRRDIYEQQFTDIESLVKKGVVPRTSLLQLQITATALDQEARQADISMIQSRQALEESRAQLASLPIERRAAITAELQSVRDRLSRSKIQFNESLARLAVLMAQSPPRESRGFVEAPLTVSISRLTGGSGDLRAAREGAWTSPVLPGDVIWIPYPELSTLDSSLPARAHQTSD
jgi:protein involved in polysaccharide export with SLBB domain